MKKYGFPCILLAASLLWHSLPAAAQDDVLTLLPPEQMPPAVGTISIATDRSLNGAKLSLYRVQPEGAFLYYSYDVTLCEALTVECPVWEGNYRLEVSLPSDATFEMVEYRYDLTIADPEMDPEQSFDTTYLTVVLDTDADAAEDTAVLSDPVTRERIIYAQHTYTFSRAEFVLGDLNGDGDVNAADAADLLISAAAAGGGTDPGLTSLQMACADLNGDGTYNSSDAADILTYAAAAAAGDFEGDALTYVRTVNLPSGTASENNG